MTFNQQHAIITGGSSGIGKATAKLLAQKGANLTLIARDTAKLEQAKVEIEAMGTHPQPKILTISADVSQQIQVEAAIEQAINQIGPADLLITSAGIAHPGYFQELPIEVFEQTMAVNYFGSLYAIKAVLPTMVKQHKGHIVLLSSGAGLIGIYGYTPYSPSKFALRGLAESLRGELKPQGIHVSIVYPPDTDTPQLEAENKTKPLETKMITGSAQMWSATAVADQIVRGIEKKQFGIMPGFEMTLLGRFHSLLAPVLNWYFDRIVTGNRESGIGNRESGED
ncbi:MAG: SDR family oxidoreductase [Moorea sp. SIO3I7]|uniref:3-dehydrosphinganine reductase n=1 Tax=Moorena bouillonii PNG TaxID=568701 RepID=A0A1U7N4G3_9CYAN|nr:MULTISPECIES: SDR family oxidoreductase [Moorena]NEO00923.1 SDR family oxidoreductase [Moorena sp. SIO3I7]NEO46972.1 SDR family oxidoreductase [Moorena sp. SIO4A3]NEO62225.1 SDR family oxidoreductase [Moorena sp. SIO4G2]NEO17304.1 SDR family oxidoreductase [Moorena sp. SIO3E8]NEQ03852.1 SDR family oxidoreductase [Moorena sp. SIO3F7]